MTDKQINTCEFLNICQTDCNGTLEDTEMCHCYELYKQLKRKEQECEEFKQTLAEIKEIAESKVKPNLIKRMNGTARYGISRIIELAEEAND